MGQGYEIEWIGMSPPFPCTPRRSELGSQKMEMRLGVADTETHLTLQPMHSPKADPKINELATPSCSTCRQDFSRPNSNRNLIHTWCLVQDKRAHFSCGSQQPRQSAS
uniref:Uncharacterized protein n=1 Tax=Eutreptiella gymnastica TaxID=73025 RepID=A0A7S4FJF1_9EUGL